MTRVSAIEAVERNLAGAPLGSQPTPLRFENAVSRTHLYRVGAGLADTVIRFHRVGSAAGPG